MNKAIAGFLSADTAIKIDGGDEFEGKYPMTILYSIYYEFSKRYPVQAILVGRGVRPGWAVLLCFRLGRPGLALRRLELGRRCSAHLGPRLRVVE